MSNLPISSKYRSTPNLPVAVEEREGLVQRLNEAYERGEVAPDDYQRLLDAVFNAQTLGELAPVVEKLPASATYAEPAMVQQAHTVEPGQLQPAVQPNRSVVFATVGIVVAGLLVLAIVAAIIIGMFL